MRPFVLFVLVALAAGCASTKPAEHSSSLALRKAALGPVAVAADFAAIQDLPGEVDRIGIEDSRRYGDALVAAVTAALRAKGYQVGPNCVASVGQALNPKESYVAVDSLGRPVADTDPTRYPPFYLEESLRGDEVQAKRWSELVQELWALPPSHPPATTFSLNAAMGLKGPLGEDVALVVTGVGWKSAPRKRHDPMTLAAAGYAGWHQSYGVVQLAMLDCRTGEVLWSDARRIRRPVRERQVEAMAMNLARGLP